MTLRNIINNNFLILCLLSTIAVISEARYCQTPDNRNGTCISIRACDILFRMATQRVLYPEDRAFLQRSKCGSKASDVCCPDAEGSPTTTTTAMPTTRRNTTPVTSPTTHYPIPTERISVKKCKEYKKFAENPPITPIAPDGQEFIIHGVPAELYEFPHMVLIGFTNKRTNNVEYLCGGSSISEQFVLSAGHCLREPTFGNATYAMFGVHNRNKTDYGTTVCRILERIRYPEYRSYYNDIILFKICRVTFTYTVRPICLPEKSDYPMQNVTAVGWGHTSWRGKPSNVMMKVNLEIFSHSECDRAYRERFRSLKDGIVDATQICARSHTEVKDTCQGDSGGPLQIDDEIYNRTYTIVGITSFGYRCGASVPGVYTRVYPYLKWIEDIVWPNE